MTENATASALAALGIDTAAVPNTAETTASTAPTDAAAAGAPAPDAEKTAAFVAGSMTDLSFDELPAQTRTFGGGGPRGTTYGFENIAAPGTDGKRYHGKLIEFKEGDVKSFKRSVQSAATSQNTQAKAAGSSVYYQTRTAEKEGKFLGVYIIRTDERPVDDNAAADAAAE